MVLLRLEVKRVWEKAGRRRYGGRMVGQEERRLLIRQSTGPFVGEVATASNRVRPEGPEQGTSLNWFIE
jgi:hypothetical protein